MGLFSRKKQTSTATDDANTLRVLASHGADFSEPREVMHYVYSSSSEALAAAAVTASEAGWSIRDSTGEGSFCYEFTAEKVINPEVIAEDRLLFEGIAAVVPDGDYDGWVASV